MISHNSRFGLILLCRSNLEIEAETQIISELREREGDTEGILSCDLSFSVDV